MLHHDTDRTSGVINNEPQHNFITQIRIKCIHHCVDTCRTHITFFFTCKTDEVECSSKNCVAEFVICQRFAPAATPSATQPTTLSAGSFNSQAKRYTTPSAIITPTILSASFQKSKVTFILFSLRTSCHCKRTICLHSEVFDKNVPVTFLFHSIFD